MKTNVSLSDYTHPIIYQSENLGGRYEYRSNEHENWRVKPHVHAYSEIAYTLEGTATVIVDGKKHLVPKNRLIFIMPNQVHQYMPLTQSVLRCAVFSSDFTPVFFEKMRRKKPLNPVVDFSSDPSVLSGLRATDPGETLKICGYLNLICDRVAAADAVEFTPKSGGIFHEVIEFVRAHYDESISLSALAKHLGYSEKYLSQKIRAFTNTNFRAFLNSFRVDAAIAKLSSAHDGCSIAKIAMDCGFDSITSFNRAFKLVTGSTPSQYLKA